MEKFILALMVCIFALSAGAQTVEQKIDALAESMTARNQFSGVISISQNGQAIYSKAFGSANREFGVPNRLTSRFRIGSVSKTLTALAILRLTELGKIDLGTPYGNYISAPAKHNSITIKQLLSHTSGLKEVIDFAVFKSEWGLRHTLAKLVEFGRNEDLLFSPGMNINYSDYNYIVLSSVIESVYKKPYSEAIQELVFTRAGMTQTGFGNLSTFIEELPTSYFFQGGKIQKGESFFLPPLNAYFTYEIGNSPGAGDIYSSASDLMALMKALRRGTVVSPATLALAVSPVENGPNVGLGWFLRTSGNKRTAYHTGWVQGFTTVFLRSLDSDLDVVVLSNLKGTESLTLGLVDPILNLF